MDAPRADALLLSRAWQAIRGTGANVGVVFKAVPAGVGSWFNVTFVDLGRQLRWVYLPPLMVYLAVGISTLTAIMVPLAMTGRIDFGSSQLLG